MRQYSTLCSVIFLVASSSLLLFAQKTVVHDAGPGLKQEFDYDAAGRVVQSRTVTTAGKLQVKVEYVYGPRAQATSQISTHYWPDGKSVQKISQERFDDNVNFTSEIIEDFDQTGKHVSGHKLFHDPMTGIYRCLDWKVAQQKYVAIDCPASEESREGPSEVRKVTREEVMQNLAAARQAAQTERKSRHMKAKPPVDAALTTVKKDVGIVLPAQMRAGQRVSGSVVEDPDRFAGDPDLSVTRVTLPFQSEGDASKLSGWTLELSGGSAQPADEGVSFVVPADGPTQFTLRQAGDSSIAVSGAVPGAKTPAQKPPAPNRYEAPALCFRQGLCVVTGRFSGDSRSTFAAFDQVPGRIVAETESTAFVEVPSDAILGPTALIVAEPRAVAVMMMVVGEFTVSPNHIEITPGQDRLSYLRVNGVSELADEQWRYGVYPASNLEKARALLPGFNPAKTVEQVREQQEREDKRDGYVNKDEKQEESAGMVLVVLRNATPELVTLRGSEQNQYVFHFTPDSFSRGDYRFCFAVDASKPGVFAVHATAIPFLAPVEARVFDGDNTAKN